jgi:flagellar basal-body rod protein FlgB
LLPGSWKRSDGISASGATTISDAMNEISDSAVMTALRRQLSLAAAKQAVSAGNLANLDTPGYRARELTFSDTLERELGTTPLKLAGTQSGHLAGVGVAEATDTVESSGLPARADGNTVQLDRELLSMVKASGQFAQAQTALAAKFRLVRYAISEGR